MEEIVRKIQEKCPELTEEVLDLISEYVAEKNWGWLTALGDAALQNMQKQLRESNS